MNELIQLLIPLLMVIESNNNPKAIGDNGDAVGILQIHEIVIDDVNRIYKKNYRYEDRLSPFKSKEICVLYLTYYGSVYQRKTGMEPTMEVLAKIWNGGEYGYKKEKTQNYWNRINELKRTNLGYITKN